MVFYYWTINISPFSTGFYTHSIYIIWQNQQCLILIIIISKWQISVFFQLVYTFTINYYHEFMIITNITLRINFSSITTIKKTITITTESNNNICLLAALIHIHCDKTYSWLLSSSSSRKRHLSRGDSCWNKCVKN